MQDILVFMQQHSTLSLSLVLVFLLLIVIEFIKQKQGGKSLSPAQVTRLINHENAVIVDVRSTDAYASGHIVSSLSLPVSDMEKQFHKIEKLKTQPIVIVCAAGLDSKRAAAFFIKKGLQPYILRGGLRAWREADMPLVKG